MAVASGQYEVVVFADVSIHGRLSTSHRCSGGTVPGAFPDFPKSRYGFSVTVSSFDVIICNVITECMPHEKRGVNVVPPGRREGFAPGWRAWGAFWAFPSVMPVFDTGIHVVGFGRETLAEELDEEGEGQRFRRPRRRLRIAGMVRAGEGMTRDDAGLGAQPCRGLGVVDAEVQQHRADRDLVQEIRQMAWAAARQANVPP